MKDEAKAKGGYARAESLTPAERAAIASQAAKRRWERQRGQTIPMVLASYSSVLDLAGMKLPCAVVVMPNGEIKRVLSETGITNAILGNRSGASKRLKTAGAPLPLFLAPGQLKPFISKELLDGPLAPIDYADGERLVRSYDAAILPAVCNVWLAAREKGELQNQQAGKAQKAEILLRALAETGIVALVDEATGYEKVRPQNALKEYLELVIRKELAAWAKRFPDEYYINIYRLKNWPWPGMSKNRYSVVAQYTRDLIYQRLGPGILEELERKSPRKADGRGRPNKLHQWLSNDIGHPMLAQHMHAILMFQRLAINRGYGWKRFLQMVDEVLPKRGTNLSLPFGEPIEP